MKINELIKQQRNCKGYSLNDVSRQIGISVFAANDIEIHEDEFTSVLKLSEAKDLTSFLGIDLSQAIGLREDAAKWTQPRNELIQESMRAGGISIQNLAEKLGFEDAAVKELLVDPDFLESWPIDLIMDLSVLLGLDPKKLLATG